MHALQEMEQGLAADKTPSSPTAAPPAVCFTGAEQQQHQTESPRLKRAHSFASAVTGVSSHRLGQTPWLLTAVLLVAYQAGAGALNIPQVCLFIVYLGDWALVAGHKH